MNRSDYDQDSVQGSQSTDHELSEEEQRKQDAELATKMSNYIDPALDKIKPLLKLINEVRLSPPSTPRCVFCLQSLLILTSCGPQNLARAQRDQEKDELDEEALVKNVKPLIEQAYGILQEALGGIKALDPGGKVSQQSSRRAADHQATPEEHHLAESLGTVRLPCNCAVRRRRAQRGLVYRCTVDW